MTLVYSSQKFKGPFKLSLGTILSACSFCFIFWIYPMPNHYIYGCYPSPEHSNVFPGLLQPLNWLAYILTIYQYSQHTEWSCVCVCALTRACSCSVVSDSLWPYGLCSQPGFSVHGIFQARILNCISISYSRAYPWPRDQTCFFACPALAGRLFTSAPPGKMIKWLEWLF